MWWLDSLGTLQRPLDPNRPRRQEPSLQLVGRPAGYDVDLPSLVDRGVRLTGRVSDIDGGTVDVADDLAITTEAADRRLERLLQRIDRYAAVRGLDRDLAAPHRPRPSSVIAADSAGHTALRAAGIDTVLWATGYRRSYPWLQVPGVVGSDGEIRHRGGRTAAPGLVALGLAQQIRKNSTFLDGVRHDAGSLVEHLCRDILPGAQPMSA